MILFSEMLKPAIVSFDLWKLMVQGHLNRLGYGKITEKYSISKATTQNGINIAKKKYELESASRSGRPRATTACEET